MHQHLILIISWSQICVCISEINYLWYLGRGQVKSRPERSWNKKLSINEEVPYLSVIQPRFYILDFYGHFFLLNVENTSKATGTDEIVLYYSFWLFRIFFKYCTYLHIIQYITWNECHDKHFILIFLMMLQSWALRCLFNSKAWKCPSLK